MIGNVTKNCEAVQLVCKVLYTVNSIGARECAAHHGIELEPLSADW
jgi:hypothetical protein